MSCDCTGRLSRDRQGAIDDARYTKRHRRVMILKEGAIDEVRCAGGSGCLLACAAPAELLQQHLHAVYVTFPERLSKRPAREVAIHTGARRDQIVSRRSHSCVYVERAAGMGLLLTRRARTALRTHQRSGSGPCRSPGITRRRRRRRAQRRC